MFPFSMWNQWHCVMDDIPTTNNAVESFNRSWNLSSNRKPNLWQTIDAFKREDSLANQKLTELLSGDYVDPNPGRKLQSEARIEKIKNIMLSYNKDDLETYFKTMIYKV